MGDCEFDFSDAPVQEKLVRVDGSMKAPEPANPYHKLFGGKMPQFPKPAAGGGKS